MSLSPGHFDFRYFPEWVSYLLSAPTADGGLCTFTSHIAGFQKGATIPGMFIEIGVL
jgi:hypothetical protein